MSACLRPRDPVRQGHLRLLKHAGSAPWCACSRSRAGPTVFAAARDGPSVADAISQKLFSLVPEKIPALTEYRDRFAHHLLLVVSGSERAVTAQMLHEFFAASEHEGEFFECDADEAESAT